MSVSKRVKPVLLLVCILGLLLSANVVGIAQDAATQDAARITQVAVTEPVPSRQALPGQFGSLSSELVDLLQAWSVGPQAGAARAEVLGLDLVGSQVEVMFIMFDAAAADAAEAAVEAAGGQVTARFDRWVEAYVPVDALPVLGQLPGLSLIQRPIAVLPLDDQMQPVLDDIMPDAGSSLTQGVAASGANLWHAAGYLGDGVTVAVLDSFAGYTTAQSLGELPSGGRLTTLGTLNLTSAHGTAVAEIVYDMAPNINLILVSPSSATEMASRITELANRPAATRPQIITSSMGFYNDEAGDGTGQVSQAINYAVSQGVMYTQAAGNQRQYNYQTAFYDPDTDNIHNYTDTANINWLNNGFTIPSGALLYIHLRWNRWPTTNQDYDLYVYKCVPPAPGTCSWWTASTTRQTGTQPPVETIAIFTDQTAWYGLVVHRFSGTDSGVILDIMGHNAPAFTHNMFDHSLVDPATGAGAFSVAALDASSPYPQMSYSSEGPALGAGGAISGGNDQPRISAFANVDTWAYGPGVFNGTSAATPHVAGAAALIRSAYPWYTVDQVKDFLEDRAVDMGAAGYDHLFGAGRLNLGITPDSQASLAVSLEGAASSVGAQVRVRLVRVSDSAVVYDGTLSIDGLGKVTVPDIPPGTYHVWVKDSRTLSSSLTSVLLEGGGYDLVVPVLRGGDADNSNTVNIADFSILAASFARASGDAGYDARADFNRNNVVNISDFSILATNFTVAGSTEGAP